MTQNAEYVPSRNAVPDRPGWWYGLATLTVDGSLYGWRTVTVYGPGGQQFEVGTPDGWTGIHRAAHAQIDSSGTP